jgi:hypothetical protein
LAGLDLPETVKIDADGHYLRILAAASEPFGKTDMYGVEAIVCAGYEDSAVEAIKCAAGARYRFIDMTDLHPSPDHDIPSLFELPF